MANLSQQKREKMLAFLAELKAKHNDDAHLQAFNEIENALIGKKYGLVWEEHSEDVEEMCKQFIPVLTEISEKALNLEENNSDSHSTATRQPLDSHSTATRQPLDSHSTATRQPLDSHSTATRQPLRINALIF